MYNKEYRLKFKYDSISCRDKSVDISLNNSEKISFEKLILTKNLLKKMKKDSFLNDSIPSGFNKNFGYLGTSLHAIKGDNLFFLSRYLGEDSKEFNVLFQVNYLSKDHELYINACGSDGSYF